MTTEPVDPHGDDLLGRFAADTAPTDDEIGAVRRSLAHHRQVSEALLRHLPEPTLGEIALARRRLRETRSPRRWGLVLGGLATASAVGLVAIGFVAGWLVFRSGDPALTGTLAATDAPIRPAPHVALTVRGTGVLGGTARAPRVDWTGGALSVEVDPGQGVDLQVVTREATVRVVGTVFTVDRDALGTKVGVGRGRVEVTCVAGPVHLLEVGESVTCAPVTAPGLLARANALKAAGADPTDILAAVDAGIPVATGPFLGELRAVRAGTLLEAGRPEEALAEARTYLETGGPRRTEILELAAAAGYRTHGCSGALPFLQDLEELGKGDPELLDRCELHP